MEKVARVGRKTLIISGKGGFDKVGNSSNTYLLIQWGVSNYLLGCAMRSKF